MQRERTGALARWGASLRSTATAKETPVSLRAGPRLAFVAKQRSVSQSMRPSKNCIKELARLACCLTTLMPGLAWPQGVEDRILVQAWAETETLISSPLVGLVQKIPFRIGQSFAKDEELVRFECKIGRAHV